VSGGAGTGSGPPAEAAGEAGEGGVVVELEVESVAVGGDGVAREPDGRVVFVPRTAPGDRVLARFTEEHGSWARAHVMRVLEAGPRRTSPPCPYYSACGGCQLQHLGYTGQLEAKRRAVGDAVERIGGRTVEVAETVAAERTLEYRNRVAFTLRRGPDDVDAGYHQWDRPDRLVDVSQCPLAEPPVNRAWKQLRSGWGQEAERLPPGDELRLTVRASAAGRVTLLVEGGGGGGGSDPGSPEAVSAAVEGLSGYFWRPEGGSRRLLAGEPEMEESWGGFDLRLPPEVFLQVNRTMSERIERSLDDEIEERAGGPEGLRILDLYAGVGTRALRWAAAGAEVEACEADEEAVAAGREASRALGLPATLHAATVEDHLERLLPADLAVVNPPRTGLSRAVAERLAGARLDALVYVSCDPATLARDLDRLGDRWTVASLRPFDAFPQTAHVETTAWLERG
jgi:23S rRNA (uracil1939-C5)-methyltransferase